MSTLITSPETSEILRNKLDKHLLGAGNRVQSHLMRIEEEGSVLNDSVVTLGNTKGISFFANDNTVNMSIQNGSTHVYKLHTNAVYQVAQKLEVPAGYLRGLVEGKNEWGHELASHILNTHTSHTTRQRLLLREVKGQVRGVLSDQYRRLNTSTIYAQFLAGAEANGLKIYDAYTNDLKSYIEVVNPNIFQVKNDQNVDIDIVFGVRISSSDFGAGSLEMRSFVMQVVCLNGMVRESILRDVHLGGRLPDNIQLADETYRADTKAKALTVRDTMKGLMNFNALEQQANIISKAVNTTVNYDNEFKALNKSGAINKEEIKEITHVLQSNRQSDGILGEGTTLWKLAQGISAVARDKEGSKMRDLQEVSGSLLKKVA